MLLMIITREDKHNINKIVSK